MKRLLYIPLFTLGVFGYAHAQIPAPARVGITSTIVPEVVQVLDNTNTWVPIGTINSATHVFTPVESSPTPTICTQVTSNITISSAGCYVVAKTQITVTLGSFSTLGAVTIADGTGNANPQITIVGTINSQSNFSLINSHESVGLTNYPPATTWTITSIFNPPSNGTPAKFIYFTGSNRVPVNQIIKFTNPTDVADWFGAGTQQSAAATTYFAGYTGPNAEFDVTRIPDGGARSRFESAPIQNLLAVLQTQCPYSATPTCPMSLTYDIDQNVAPGGYTVSITPCFDATPNCTPGVENISGGSFSTSPNQATLTWVTPITAVPYPAGDGSVTIAGSVITGGSPSTLDGTYTGPAGTLVNANAVSITINTGAITGSPVLTAAGTITFNPSLQQVAANINDSLNTAIFNNPYAITTGSSIVDESCQMNAGTQLIGQFAYVTGTVAGCTLPIGVNINSTITGVIIMAQEQGPPCAVGEISCTQSAVSRSLTPQTPTPAGFFGCAPATGNFVPSGNCPGSLAGKYTIWTTACCLQYQVGPATSGPGSTANPFIAFWEQFTVGTMTGNGKIATGMALAAANPSLINIFGGNGPGSPVEYGYCASSGTDALGDPSCPGSGIWSYVGGGTVTVTPSGTFCVNSGCIGTSWVVPCGFAGALSGYAFCNPYTSAAIDIISPPIQVTYATTTGPDGLTGKFEVEQSAWATYSMPYGTMQFPTGPGAVALNMAAGSTGIGSGGQTWSPWLTSASQVMLSYTAFLTHFIETVSRDFSGFSIPTDPDAYFGYNWQQQAVEAWSIANGYNYLEYYRLYPWPLADWGPASCVPTITTISTPGSGTLPQTHCRTMTITMTGASGNLNGSFKGGTGAQVTIGPITGPADTGPTQWTYTIAAGSSGAVSTVTNGAVIQTNGGTISVPAGLNATGSASGAGGTAPTGDEAYGGTTEGWADETSINGTAGGATGGPANAIFVFQTAN